MPRQCCLDNRIWTASRLGHATFSPAMFAYSQHISRRFRLGDSVGPAFSNVNSIVQGFPLAILRINGLSAAWARSVQHHPLAALCFIGALVDIKMREHIHSTNYKRPSMSQQVSTISTPLSAQTNGHFPHRRRKETTHTHISLCGQPMKQVPDDRLLAGPFSFTKRRARFLATIALEIASRQNASSSVRSTSRFERVYSSQPVPPNTTLASSWVCATRNSKKSQYRAQGDMARA